MYRILVISLAQSQLIILEQSTHSFKTAEITELIIAKEKKLINQMKLLILKYLSSFLTFVA